MLVLLEPLNLVAVMDDIVYAALAGYYTTLSKLGYYKYEEVFKLLVLSFYNDAIYNDYRGILSKSDYREIEKALNCLYGTNCLIPYPDYLKMGKLRLGEISELAQRVKTLENTEVLKSVDADLSDDSDFYFVEEDNNNE